MPWRPWSDADSCTFILLEANRQWFVGCNRQLLVVAPGANDPVQLEPLPETLFTDGVSDGTSVTWSEVQLHGFGSRLRSWGTTEGIRTLVNGLDADVCKVAVGGGSRVGWSVRPDGIRECAAFQPNGQFHWHGSDGVDRDSPVIEEQLFVPKLATWGPTIAAVISWPIPGNAFNGFAVLLIRSSDWSARRIEPTPDHEVLDVALSDRYMYSVETPLDARRGTFQHVRRYDLERFEDLGIPFAWSDP
jgi:hypothetical protein